MNEVVLVTTYQREELLWLCLEAIRREDSEIQIRVYSDRGALSDDLVKATKQFNAERWITDLHRNYGNSWNLLEACQNATAEYVYEIVHLIEDDTIIHPGYLKWAREKLAECNYWDGKETPAYAATLGRVGQPAYAAVCGRIGSPHIPNWYESPCASWNADCLRTALGHIVPEYFSPNRMVMQRVLDDVMFPKSKYKKGGSEQDGFLLRCIEHHGWKTVFPDTPLATHFGAWGYNQPPGRERPTGSLEERVQFCRDRLKDKEWRKRMFGLSITEKEMKGWTP